MKLEQLVQLVAKNVGEQVVRSIAELPQLKWIQSQMDAQDFSAWHARMTDYAQEIGAQIRNHFGIELTPEQIIVCVSNDCGDRNASEFAYSLIYDRRHLAKWAMTFGSETSL